MVLGVHLPADPMDRSKANRKGAGKIQVTCDTGMKNCIGVVSVERDASKAIEVFGGVDKR